MTFGNTRASTITTFQPKDIGIATIIRGQTLLRFAPKTIPFIQTNPLPSDEGKTAGPLPKKIAPPLTPVPPSCPPPSHILEAAKNRGCSAVGTDDPIIAEPSSTEYKVLRWMSWALRYGVNTHGIEVSNGWSHIHVLAKAASSARKDFLGFTSGALRTIIELDESGRWCIAGGRVCKVPRQARFLMHDVRSKPTDSNRYINGPEEESTFY